jgi:hypothetical protein
MDKFDLLLETYLELLPERIVKKYVWRKGKRTVKRFASKPGYKIKGGVEIRMTREEMKRRSKAAKKVGKRGRTKKARAKTLHKTLGRKTHK